METNSIQSLKETEEKPAKPRARRLDFILPDSILDAFYQTLCK